MAKGVGVVISDPNVTGLRKFYRIEITKIVNPLIRTARCKQELVAVDSADLFADFIACLLFDECGKGRVLVPCDVGV